MSGNPTSLESGTSVDRRAYVGQPDWNVLYDGLGTSAAYANGASYPVGVVFGRTVTFDRVHVHTAVQGKIQARENGTWVDATAGSGYPIPSGTSGIVSLRRAFAATEVRFVPNGGGFVYELRAGAGAAVDLR